jgi:hypothetical protein
MLYLVVLNGEDDSRVVEAPTCEDALRLWREEMGLCHGEEWEEDPEGVHWLLDHPVIGTRETER